VFFLTLVLSKALCSSACAWRLATNHQGTSLDMP
jgi:hypothetical protein